MERSALGIRYDIEYRPNNFRKCYESAPVGYKFVTNHNKDDDDKYSRNTQWYIDSGFLVLPTAYNMYDEELPRNYVAIYQKIQ